MLAHCLVRLAGFEPATLGLEGRCSIRVSYRRRILYLFNINLLLFTGHISIVTRLIIGRGREITKYILYFTLWVVLRTFKIAPGDFVLRAPALRPLGRAPHVQNRSRRFCRTLPFASLPD